jgi:hypothetical protein
MLDGLPTELLDSIEVYKSLTPDQDLDSIGGRVEFNTKSALDLDGTYLKLKVNTNTTIKHIIMIILKSHLPTEI